MVTACVLCVVTSLAAHAPGDSSMAPDSSALGAHDPPETLEALDALELEDAWFESGEEPGFLAPPATAARARGTEDGFRATGRALWARGGAQVTAGIGTPALRFDALAAREPGERRLADDVTIALAARPARAVSIAVGRVLPAVGAGLVLGPRRAGASRAPALAGRPGLPVALEDAPTTSPARAATSFRGLWATAARGGWAIGVLAADTRRDARPSGEAWWPVASTRHRDAEEEARRGRLAERVLALAVARDGGDPSRLRVWMLAAHGRTGARRVPPLSTSQAAEAAAPIERGGGACEAGFSLDGAPRLSGALALDPRGRTRTWLALEARTRGAITDLAVESEARGFSPLRALPERRAHMRVFARMRARTDRRGDGHGHRWSVEAHLAERSPFDPARVWLAARLVPRTGWFLELRRDSAPKRTVVAVSASRPARDRWTLRGGVELRFDAHGLLRETWRLAAVARVPGRLVLEAEARMGSGRGNTATAETDLPGGGFTRWSGGIARTRFEVRRTGALSPWVAAVRTTSGLGSALEVRLGLDWIAGPP